MTPPPLSTGSSPEICNHLPTRRDLLASALALPLPTPLPRAQIIHDHTLLAQESAKGFHRLLGSVSVPLIALPAAQAIPRTLALRLRRAAVAGSWILIESGLCFEAANNWAPLSSVLREFFNIQIAAPLRVSGLYVSFHWPRQALTRTFEAVTPVRCSAAEAIAAFAGIPVAARRRVGRGGVVFLGTMLGPGLAAEEREARLIGSGFI